MKFVGKDILKSLTIERTTGSELVLHLLRFWYLMFTGVTDGLFGVRLSRDPGYSAPCVQCLNQVAVNVDY